jgi:hypothetical protein
MVALSKGILDILCLEFGSNEVIWRISDPFWFQALSCILGFDWHSSGTTTVTCGALKEAIDPTQMGFAIAGGKGRASRKTLTEIKGVGSRFNLSSDSIEELQYLSRMAAKIDSVAVQDGHGLYHHVFLFNEKGKWAIIQQGMNHELKYARRYHWSSEKAGNLVCEPHAGIIAETSVNVVLDMTAKQSNTAQQIAVDLVNDNPRHLKHDWALITKPRPQRTLKDWINIPQDYHSHPQLNMPRSINWNLMHMIYDIQPRNFEQLLAIKGVGGSTVRALALISDLIYGEKPSWSDPIRFTYAHGGKDGVPFPVDRKTMNESTTILTEGVHQAKIGDREKLHAIQRLCGFYLQQMKNF